MANCLRNDTRQEDPYIFNGALREEQIRVDEQSLVINILMHDNPIHAPILNPSKILEIGYGTGQMCDLFGRTFPDAAILGVDPGPPPIGFREKRENVEYIQGKYEDLLAAGDARLELASFDYIFVRMAVCWVTDWPSHVRRIWSLLKAVGWAELQDLSMLNFSGTDPQPVDQNWEWAHAWRKACPGNIDWASGINLEARMREGGFNDVNSVEYPFCICNPWPGKPETQPVAAYTAKYVPPVTFALLDQYDRDKYSVHEIEQMKDSAQETAFSAESQIHTYTNG